MLGDQPGASITVAAPSGSSLSLKSTEHIDMVGSRTGIIRPFLGMKKQMLFQNRQINKRQVWQSAERVLHDEYSNGHQTWMLLKRVQVQKPLLIHKTSQVFSKKPLFSGFQGILLGNWSYYTPKCFLPPGQWSTEGRRVWGLGFPHCSSFFVEEPTQWLTARSELLNG